MLSDGNPVVHHEGPALAAQVDRPKEEVLLMLIHLPRQCGLYNLCRKLTVRGQYRKTVSEGTMLLLCNVLLQSCSLLRQSRDVRCTVATVAVAAESATGHAFTLCISCVLF
jgi:hypothetical protein